MTAVGEVSNAMANYKGSTERLNLVSKKGSLWIKLPKMPHYCIKWYGHISGGNLRAKCKITE